MFVSGCSPPGAATGRAAAVGARGSGTLECDAGSVALQPGTAIHFAPHAWHSTVFDKDTLLMEVNLAA